ncbi:homeodomain-interacting protein kinase 4-like [Bombina bombina]|uniref:homeodomain-interacting protein kinase 4-like n=1 Tax=Bombina bombina TaxID=8345 RepID=UPI00235AAEB2|nr:homeodomain-interacting protein kinase 4-like [Bombina bombina]
MEHLRSKTDYYDIMDFLADGSFGNVVKGKKRSSGELVAIKLHKENISRKEIMNEIEMLNALRQVDPEEWHIIRFYEYFYCNIKYYFVFEHLQKDLFEFQRERKFSPLPIMHIRTITTQLLKALSKLKELSIIHTDLKPENIMIVDQARYPFRVKLIDFGSSIYLDTAKKMKKPSIQTRFFRSPEILLGLPFCEMIDIWSLGCIMAELHLGSPLYPGQNEYDQIRYICSTQGMPNSHLLSEGMKTYNFFTKKADKFKLKSKKEFYLETHVKPLEKRKFIFQSLDDLELVTAQPSKERTEALAEYEDLKAMVDLIKRMLTWDSHERIDPNAALSHPYISLSDMKIKYKYTEYLQLSTSSLNNALKQYQSQQYTVSPDNNCGQCLADYHHEEKKQGLASMSPLSRNNDSVDLKFTEDLTKKVSEVKNHLPEISLGTPDSCYLPAYKINLPNSKQTEDITTHNLFIKDVSKNDVRVRGNNSTNHRGSPPSTSSKHRQIYKRLRQPSTEDSQDPPQKMRIISN